MPLFLAITVSTFLLLLLSTYSSQIAKNVLQFIFRKSYKEKELKREQDRLNEEIKTIPMIDEFAKYARLERKILKINTTLVQKSKERSQKIFIGNIVLKCVFYFIQVLFFLWIMWFYRTQRVLSVSSHWTYPIHSFLSMSSSSGGFVAAGAWLIISRTALSRIVPCFTENHDFELDDLNNNLTAEQIEQLTNLGIDISPRKDKGLLKVVMKEGRGKNRPLIEDKVHIRYHMWYKNGEKIKHFGNKYSFLFGKGDTILAWEFAVGCMKEGEEAFIISSDIFPEGTQGFPSYVPQNTFLVFHLKVIKWHGKDISKTKDGSLYKSTIESGEMYGIPNDGAVCTVHIVGKYQEREFEDREVIFTHGEGENEGIVKGVEEAIIGFSRGEKARLKVKSALAYGEKGCAVHNIPPNADIEYDVYLKDCVRMKDFWEMSNEEKIEQSKKDKEKGIKYFKENNLTQAKKFFNKVKEYLQFITKDSDKETQTLLTSCLVNMAICCLKTDDAFTAEKVCTQALELVPDLTKALYNRAQAHIRMQNHEKAKKDLEMVLRAEDNAAVRKQLNTTLENIGKANKIEKLRFKKMFGEG